MDFWPVRHEPAETKGNIRRQTNVYEYNVSSTGPVLSTGNGTSTTAVLRSYRFVEESTRKCLEWDFIAREGSRLRAYPSSTLLPERKFDITQPIKLPLHRRAEEGARFLRQRFPDVDIPFEIIKEYIEDDHAYQERHNTLPSMGNCLAMIHSHHPSKDRQIALAFPMGPLRNQLNLSSSSWSRSRGSVLNVASSPVATFDTPVLQIVASTYNQDSSPTPALPTFAVRTMSFCALFSVNFGTTRSLFNQPSVNQLTLVKPGETGTIVDIAASPFAFSRTLLVNEMGVISLLQADNARATSIPLDTPAKADSFWRVCWANEENTALRASSNQLELLDLRGGPANLGMELTPKERITALEARTSDATIDPHLIAITTDKRVVWLDDRYLATPLISWEHSRARDVTLKANSYSLGLRSITCLSSQNNGLLTFYDVSASSGLMHGNGTPQILECSPGSRKRIGQTFYRHPASEHEDINFVELSAGGGLFSTRISLSDNAGEPSAETDGGPQSVHRGAMVSQWTQRAENEGTSRVSADNSDASAGRQSFEVDFSQAYQEFVTQVMSKFMKGESIEEVRDVLERMPRIGQESDQPLESILTMYDIASQASAEPGHIARSDFLTGTILNSGRAQSVFQSRHLMSSQAIVKSSAWSFDLTRSIDLIRTFDPRTAQIGEQLVTYNGNQHDMQCLLDIDLALFNDVCSFIPFHSSRKVAASTQSEDDTLQQTTQSLSIIRIKDAPLPPLAFSFLKPRPQQVPPLDDPPTSPLITDPVGDIQDISRGTLLLLSEWQIGSDPELLGHTNPYPHVMSKGGKDRAQATLVKQHHRRDSSPQTQPQLLSAPPKIGLVPGTPSIRTSRGVKFGALGSTQVPISVETQPTSSRVDLVTRSQDPGFLGISTQVLPGKHGGRSKGGGSKSQRRGWEDFEVGIRRSVKCTDENIPLF